MLSNSLSYPSRAPLAHHNAPVGHTPSALVVIARYWPALGGAQIHTRYMCHALKNLGIHSKVFSHCSDEELSNERAILEAQNLARDDQGIAIAQVPYKGQSKPLINWLSKRYAEHRISRPFFNYGIRRFSCREIMHEAVDYDVIHNVYSGLTMVTEAACAAARKLNKPFIFTPLARTCDGDKSVWRSARMKRVYAQSDAIVALTEHERQWLIEQGVDAAKVHVCPMASVLSERIDGTAFREQYALQNTPYVLFLGRHDTDKGYHAVLASMQAVWKHHPQLHFVFFGPQTPESRDDFKALNDPRIRVIETPSQELKTAALAECELLCVPSIKESLGVVYLEAWQMAKPVIAGDIPLLRELVSEHEDGLVTSQDPEQVAQAIRHLIDQPELLKTMGRNGLKKVEKSYTWPVVATKLARIFQDALKQELPKQKVLKQDPMQQSVLEHNVLKKMY